MRHQPHPPGYAPDGSHLVAALTLTGPNEDPSEDDARRRCGEIYGVDVSDWRLVSTSEVPATLPDLPPGESGGRRTWASGRLAACGD